MAQAKTPYHRPGLDEGKPPTSPTQFCPEKPLGPDPVSPVPTPEGTEYDRHAQIYALDKTDGLFKPVCWVDGRLAVDTELVANIDFGAVGDPLNVYDEAPSVAIGTETEVVKFSVPTAKVLYLKHSEFSGENFGIYKIKIGTTVHRTFRTHDGLGLTGKIEWGDFQTPGGLPVLAGETISLTVKHNGFVIGDFEGSLYGRLLDV